MKAVWNRRQTLAGLMLAVALPFAAAQAAETIKVQDNTGEVVVPLKPKTVLVYDFGALDIIKTIGGQVAGNPTQALPRSRNMGIAASTPTSARCLSLTMKKSKHSSPI